ncbi:hypothetical protein BON67_04490 [Escherichia coli]|nr:hypothetical protein BON67_04490 [Escherichia coli]
MWPQINVKRLAGRVMLTGAFLYLPLVFMPEADSLKHPQQFYLTILFPQIVLSSTQISPVPPTRVPYPKAVSLFTQKIINVLFFTNNQLRAICGWSRLAVAFSFMHCTHSCSNIFLYVQKDFSCTALTSIHSVC